MLKSWRIGALVFGVFGGFGVQLYQAVCPDFDVFSCEEGMLRWWHVPATCGELVYVDQL